MKTIYICSKCKGRNVSFVAWVYPNDDFKVVPREPVFDLNQAPKDICAQYCDDCKEEVNLETIEVEE